MAYVVPNFEEGEVRPMVALELYVSIHPCPNASGSHAYVYEIEDLSLTPSLFIENIYSTSPPRDSPYFILRDVLERILNQPKFTFLH